MGVFNETARSEAMIVGMSGTNGAGKDTGADYLVKNHGCMYQLAKFLRPRQTD
jgi:putative protein kinase ArgK-like GTPase of G3E family